MATPQISTDIIPLSRFKSQASQLLDGLKANRRPLVLTQNGVPAAVLLSPQEFDLLRERSSFLDAVREGLSDLAAGRVVDDEDLDLEGV